MERPSDRIKEIYKALKILDGQDQNKTNFGDMSFFEQAILNYLDEQKYGISIQQRTGEPEYNSTKYKML